ncbi:MAG: hypothetical protein A4E66_02087 [Syntrophus sp. PtaB.Bin001]|nr:MAG: hypothetical protein A4E66_02087 [Syntrophus sp. PtaB.Bin001]
MDAVDQVPETFFTFLESLFSFLLQREIDCYAEQRRLPLRSAHGGVDGINGYWGVVFSF